MRCYVSLKLHFNTQTRFRFPWTARETENPRTAGAAFDNEFKIELTQLTLPHFSGPNINKFLQGCNLYLSTCAIHTNNDC